MQDKTNQKDALGYPYGSWIAYHRDGRLWYKETYDMGKLIGYCIEYRFDGNLKYKRFYAR
jgi:antitoxin component YwqK of YwqJK toxin-antitoxin module